MSWMSLTKNPCGILFVALLATINAEDCVPREYGYGSVVCVCNSTYCDSAAVNVPAKGQYRIYESGKSGKRMSQLTGSIDTGTSDNYGVNSISLTLSPDQTFQTLHGFGGAFTDAAGINMKLLSQGAQDRIMETYYCKNGSRYTLGRVPIGGTDFSTRPYSYDDSPTPDITLSKFGLAHEDYEYKIPFIHKALRINPDLKLITAAWSAPAWMKTNNKLTGSGSLRKEYYQAYADYLARFLTDYQNQGVKIWAITTGNEPANALIPFIIKFNSMGWTPSTMATWIAENLGPTIAKSASNDTLIVMLDDQRFNLPVYAYAVLKHPTAKDYIAGIATHWYWDTVITPKVLDVTHNAYPDKFLIQTEACTGSAYTDNPKVRLGDWRRGERYILNIMESLNHWMTGWIDWNLALDTEGGPNWVENFVDSPIIVHPETDEFFKQPMYYALAHFSKFVGPGSKRIGITSSRDVDNIAFLTPDKEIVIVLYNRNKMEKAVTITDAEQGKISTTVPALSIQTIIYRR